MRKALALLAPVAFVALLGPLLDLSPASAQTVQTPEVATVDMGQYLYPAGMDVAGDVVYVAARSGGLRVFQFTPPASAGQAPSLVEIGFRDTTPDPSALGRSNDVQVVGDYAYVADGVGGVSIVNVSDPRNPGAPVTFPTPGSAKAARVIGDKLYVACGPETWDDTTSFYGLVVAQLPADQNAQPPVELGRFAAERPAELPVLAGGGGFPIHMDVKEKDGVIYAAFGFPGLYALDATDPANIRELGRLRPPALPGHPPFNTYASFIRFRDDRLLVGFMCLGVYELDATRQTDGTVAFSTASITRVATPAGYVRRFDFLGDRLIVAERFDGLRALDLTRLVTTSETGVLAHPTVAEGTVPDAFDVRVIGDYAVVADFGQTLNELGGFWAPGAHGWLRVFDLTGLPASSPIAASSIPLLTTGANAAIRHRAQQP